jgi:hypothetical protein
MPYLPITKNPARRAGFFVWLNIGIAFCLAEPLRVMLRPHYNGKARRRTLLESAPAGWLYG